jgi:phage FluMu protein Com
MVAVIAIVEVWVEVRCRACARLLCRIREGSTVEIKCKCGRLNVVKLGGGGN